MRKLENFLEIRGKKTLFAIILLFLVSVVYINATDTIFQIGKEGVNDEEYAEYIEPILIEKGEVIKSEISSPSAYVKYIALKFDTANTATGTLQVSLLEEDTVVESWNVELELLANNEYKKFDISKVIFDENGTYYITVSNQNGTAENISVHMIKDEIVYQYYYSYKDGSILLAVLTFVILITVVLIYKNVKKENIMVFILAMVEILYFWTLPIGAAPDETSHFLRAFEISRGELVSEHMAGLDLGGNYLPVGLANYQNPDAQLDWENSQVYFFGNTALYAPISYLPQALGIRIATFFTSNVAMIFSFGRLGAAIINFILCVWALKKLPFGKEIMFLIMLFPMTMQEMIAMSADGFTTALSFALVSYVLYLAYEKEKVESMDLGILTSLTICLALCKIVYIVVAVVILIIPSSKFKTDKKAIWWKTGIIGITIIINLIWLMKSSTYLIEFMPGVQSKRQISYIIMHIEKYYVTIIRTMLADFQGWFQTMFGSNLGSLNIPVSSVMWIMYLLLLTYETLTCKIQKVSVRYTDVLCYLVIFFGGVGLVCTSLYVQWTAYMNPVISGIQGRYFIPILIFLPFCFIYNLNKKRMWQMEKAGIVQERKSFMYLWVVFFNAMALVEILEFKLNYYLLYS